MDFPNAFTGRKTRPSAKDLSKALGPSLEPWNKLISWLKTEKRLNCRTWHSVSPKYGWALRPALKKRNILYMGPCGGCFRVSFVLSDRAVAAVQTSDVSPEVKKQIATARRYAEGTGVYFLVKSSGDLPSIERLVDIKLRN